MDINPYTPGENEEREDGGVEDVGGDVLVGVLALEGTPDVSKDVSKERVDILADGSIEIPLHMREKLGIKTWDDLAFSIEGDAIIITKATIPQVKAAEPRSPYLADGTSGGNYNSSIPCHRGEPSGEPALINDMLKISRI